MHRPVLLTLFTTVSICGRGGPSVSATIPSEKPEGQAHIVRHDRPQVDELDTQPTQVLRNELLQVFARVPEVVQGGLDGVQRRAIRDDGQVLAFLQDLGLTERELVVGRRYLLDSRTV